MKTPLSYLLEVLLCSGLLLGFYRVLLVRKVSFGICRRYLLAAVVLSVVLPALQIPFYPARTAVCPVPLLLAAPAGSSQADRSDDEPLVEFPEAVSAAAVAGDVPAVDRTGALRTAAGSLYGAVCLVLLGSFAGRWRALRRLRKRARLTDCGAYTLAEHHSVSVPFSFLRTVFLGDGFEGRQRDVVLYHEASHVRHRHSLERIFAELACCFFWFDPFVWMAAGWLREVHEWEADRDVLRAGYDLTEYRTIVFRQLFGYNPDIACGLNHSFTKTRFAMMTQFKERRFAALRLGAAVPLVAAMAMLCSFTVRPDVPVPYSVADDSTLLRVRVSEEGIRVDGELRSREDLPDIVAAARERFGAQTRVLLATEGAAPAPDLAGLEPVPVHCVLIYVDIEPNGGPKGLSLRYLPVNDAKYRAASRSGRLKITDPNGTDMTQWALKRYGVAARNPRFLVDGRLLTPEEYYEVRYADPRNAGQDVCPTVYAGAAVGERLGDPSVDVLVVCDLPGRIAPDGGLPAGACGAGLAKIRIEADGTLLLDGRKMTLAALETELAERRASLADDDPGCNAELSAEAAVPMGRVQEVLDALRRASQLKVRYRISGSGSVLRVLPPLPGRAADGRVEVLSEPLAVVPDDAAGVRRVELKVAERNLFEVMVDAEGRVLAGSGGRLSACSPEELTALAEEFLANATDDPQRAYHRTAEFATSDGRTVACRVGDGLVVLRAMRETPYEAYFCVRRALTLAYDRLRDGLAQECFGRSFGALTDAERKIAMQAVPVRIFEAELREAVR